MTICAGAICADAGSNQAVVVTSDRMVTWANLIEFEHAVPKMTPSPPRAVVMAAGDALIAEALIDRVVRSGPRSVTELVDALSKAYLETRQERAESQVLIPRGLSWSAYFGQHAQLQPQIVVMVDQLLAQFNLGIELLVGGVDDAGGHLYSIYNPGGVEQRHDVIGFAAIGSGTLHALQSMIGFGHTGKDDLKETVFRVYASKRRAEVAPGVGKGTDLWIVRASGIKAVEPDVMEELEKLYEEFLASVAKDLGGRISKLGIAQDDGDGKQARSSLEREKGKA